MIHYVTTNGIGDAWVGNELRVVRGEGLPVVLHAMRAPHQHFFASEWAAQLHRETRQIYPLPKGRLARDILAAPVRFGGRFWSALGNALFGRRESVRARLSCLAHFFVACRWASELKRRREPVSLVHSPWSHAGASIAMYGAWLLDAPFSFMGHGADLFRDRVALADKVRRAVFIGCISDFHRQLYKSLGARDEQLAIVHCGIDVSHFAPKDVASGEGQGVASTTSTPSTENGQPTTNKSVHILSSSRLVGKKGFRYLIEACRILVGRGVDLRCTIAGSGPLEAELRRQVSEAGLEGRITITGKPLKQEEIPGFMHGGDIYCLACVPATDGDMDGVPQMLMEAMACGLPVVSTRVSGIPDLIINDRTGLLVEPHEATALADALQSLIDDPARAATLAEAGRRWVHEQFDISTCLKSLINHYRSCVARGPSPEALAPPAPPREQPAAATTR